MSISHEEIVQTSSATEKALQTLKGKENPFESLVRPQQADDFTALDVSEIHQEERKQLLEAIDWYRLPEYQNNENLRPSRIVTIRGDRGSGKTHLLQSLLSSCIDSKPRVIARAQFFEGKVEIEEFLVSQLKTSLERKDEFHADRPIDAIAHGLTRRLLCQAIHAAGPADRLFALGTRGGARFRLLWGGGERLLRRFDILLKKLAEPMLSNDIVEVVTRQGISAQMAFRLVNGHLHTFEVGRDLPLAIRRLFYASLARMTLLDDDEGPARFLSQEYQDADPSHLLSRPELVGSLLRILTETCALVRMPIVFAFDNLEGLLSPLNRFDSDLAHTFVTALAQAVDRTRGVLFLVFAEGGLFGQELLPFLSDSFERPRWEQGVPIQGRGPTYLIDLKKPSIQSLQKLIQCKVEPLLASMSEVDKPPEFFPFGPDFFTDLAAGTPNLRNILRRLRDEYDRVVFGKLPSGIESNGGNGTPSPTDWPMLLESAWTRGLSFASKNLNSTSQHDLHGCLGRMLQAALPLNLEGWVLTKVEPSIPVGENPNYGVISLLDWKVQDGQTPVKGPQSLRVGVGFLLAGSRGMASDLKAKFDLLHERKYGVRLVILWQTKREGDDLAPLLPRDTRKIWDHEEANHRRTELRRIQETDLRLVLAFLKLLQDVGETAQKSPPETVVKEFLHQKLEKLFPLLLPPMQQSSGGTTDG